MFSQKDFIELSRKFVCVRLESYESKEHQDMVRSFLNGRFENTAFCVLSPDGKERLSHTGRSPEMGLVGGGRPPRGPKGSEKEAAMEAMQRIAAKYEVKGDPNIPVVQDFHTFRQALNVASGDQRLLLFVAVPHFSQDKIRQSLRPIMGAPDVIGRYHVDIGGREDTKWTEALEGESGRPGLYIIRPSKFGQEGKVVATLPLEATSEQIKSALAKANAEYAKTEERKVYSDHVADGRKERIYFEGGMPYGEDRDGDGKIDRRPPGVARRPGSGTVGGSPTLDALTPD